MPGASGISGDTDVPEKNARPTLIFMMDDDEAGDAAVDRMCTKILPLALQASKDEAARRAGGAGAGAAAGVGVVDVRVGSLRFASAAAAVLLEEARRARVAAAAAADDEDNEEDEEEEEEEVTPLVFYKDPAELCVGVNDRAVARRAVRAAANRAVGWQQWMVDRLIDAATGYPAADAEATLAAARDALGVPDGLTLAPP